MIDCSNEITGFYKKHVRLSKDELDKVTGYRDANKNRLESGLKKKELPLPIRHINQGSYAMRTINQHPKNDYDIDVGVVFRKEDLVGPQGGDKTALDTRKMVCDAVQDDKFKNPPEVRKNCVRVYYNEGYHVDMPVYRESPKDNGETLIELAGSDWTESDPEAVTIWFNKAVIDKSPDETNGRQMRRIIRLLKYWSRSRDSWNMPTGFIISKLVDECYVSKKDRDDESLYQTMIKIRDRLRVSKTVDHPVLPGVQISDGKEAALQEFYDRLDAAVKDLSALEDSECTKQKALKTWKKIFSHDYFSDQLNSLASEAMGPVYIAKKTPDQPVDRAGESRFA